LHDAPAAESVNVACVGDSITRGYRIRKQQSKYPNVLGELLGEGFEVRNFGVNGTTLLQKGTKPWQNTGAMQSVTEWSPQIVIIMLGTNDSGPKNRVHIADFANDYAELIDHFQGLPSKPNVWVCLPVPIYRTEGGFTEMLDGKIIPTIRKVAGEKKVPLIDVHTPLSGQPTLFPDKVHPNSAGQEIIAKTIHAALTAKKN
jgi:lysophospholipase L1-like esterase